MLDAIGALLVVTLFGAAFSANAQVAIAPTAPAPVVQVVVEPPANTQLCSCITYARTLVPSLPLVDAIDLSPNSVALVGNVVVLKYANGLGHVAVITDLEADGVWVKEANYHKCTKDERFIPFSDKNIIGYWSPTP